ncbi:tRNA methyltransferase ppm2 [Diatrype stigma]|uniref:Leucine carboxyl methyltransferase 1 n=1 Tax=Diatrype stigma TaxID=117547 RepID=A0AAN9YJ74_9PEZI
MAPVSQSNAASSAGRSAKQRAQDDSVMATNSSSIVSKRSVERIYYPNEPHFFRFFVKKFQRRAPLINRGYHLRMHIIDVAVRRFLQNPSTKQKVVVNLGCGSDVLPWQCLTRYPDHCQGVKFVDVDFPDLMKKKCRVVQETPELLALLSGIRSTTAEGHLVFQSDQYVQVGCDLRALSSIEQSLSTLLSLPDSEFFFVAEVSITYMETEAADSVIKWASSLGQAEFCLLEQILPDGPDHPFAQTMLHHFEKLKTPLKREKDAGSY